MEYAHRSTKAQVRGKEWTSIEPRIRFHSTACGISQVVMSQGSNEKRRSATESLTRLCIANATCAVRSCGNHPTQCCPRKHCELSTFYSVNTGDVSNELHDLGNQDVASGCDDQLFTSDYAEQRSVERCATRLVSPKSTRGDVFVALLCELARSWTQSVAHSPDLREVM